jgi:3-phenylpropionate/cinnamic acid dioxygenase small subunit
MEFAMSAEERIRRTLALYPKCHDARDAEGYAALFAHDGRFVGANEVGYAGRDAIKQFITDLYASQPADRRTKHLCGNSLIDVDGERAQAETDFVAYERLGDGPWQVHTIGRYMDQLVCEQGEWRFAERRVVSAARPHG